MDRRHELEKVRLLRILLCALRRAKSCVWSVSDVSPCRLRPSHYYELHSRPDERRSHPCFGAAGPRPNHCDEEGVHAFCCGENSCAAGQLCRLICRLFCCLFCHLLCGLLCSLLCRLVTLWFRPTHAVCMRPGRYERLRRHRDDLLVVRGVSNVHRRQQDCCHAHDSTYEHMESRSHSSSPSRTTRTRARTYKHNHTHPCAPSTSSTTTHTYTTKCTQKNTHTQPYSCTYTQTHHTHVAAPCTRKRTTHVRTHAHTHAHAQTNARAHARTHTRARARTHARTHACALASDTRLRSHETVLYLVCRLPLGKKKYSC